MKVKSISSEMYPNDKCEMMGKFAALLMKVLSNRKSLMGFITNIAAKGPQ